MGKSNRTYTEEFKRDAVSLALRSPSVKSAANSLGIPEGTLSTWMRNINEKNSSIKSSSNVVDYADELKKLRRENARLKEEREILKKFATFIARESK